MAVQYRAHKYLEELYEPNISEDHHFGEDNLQEVHKAFRAMFTDIRRVSGWDEPQKLYPEVQNKNAFVKDQMAERLFPTIYLVDHCSLLSMFSVKSTKYKNFREEKIRDKKEDIELQKKLIRKKDKELEPIHKIVEK